MTAPRPLCPRYAIGEEVERWTPTGPERARVTRILGGDKTARAVYQVTTAPGLNYMDAARFLRRPQGGQ